MGIAATRINGRYYSFASIEMSLIKPNGKSEIFIEISDLNYSDALNIELMKGSARRAYGVTSGEYEPGDVSFSLAKSVFQTGIVEAIGDGWLGANIQIVAKYSDVGEPLTVDEVLCIITGAEDAHSSGPAGLVVKVACKGLDIVRNGVKSIA
jgi:hypothetical protein